MKNFSFHGPCYLWAAILIFSFAMPGQTIANNPDELFFSLDCPPDVTISCEDDLHDLDKYGKAYVHDYSGRRPAKKPKVERKLNSCGKGKIIRTWTEEDYHWNIHQCSQTIYVEGGGLDEKDIIWPENYELEGCHPDPDPRNLPKENSFPRYKKLDCAEPMASYKDEVFVFSKSCKKVIRKWTVIDWCEYNPNERPLPGHFTHYQVIKISASEKPVLECPKDTTYPAVRSCDSTLVELDSVRAFTKCDSNLTIKNNSPYAFEDGPDASGIYPVGTTKVTFTVEYGCGKDTSCSVLITVTPEKGPVPYCRDGIITTLMGVDTNDDGRFDDGMVEIWAKDFDIGSFHPCGNIPVFFSFSADSIVMTRTFTCADLGENEVRIYVSDENGNQTYCRTKLTIQNNNVNIPDCERDTTGGGGTTTGPVLTFSSIFGDVKTDQNRAVPATDITMIAFDQDTILSSVTDTVISARLDTIQLPNGGSRVEIVIDTTVNITYDTSYGDLVVEEITDEKGDYSFGKWLNGKKYELSAARTSADVNEGLDILDALLMIQHLIGAATIETPYRYIAADVNGDKVVDYTDFQILYDVVMGLRSSFPGERNWTFVPATHQFADPNDPWADPVPESVTIDPLQKNTNVGFIGVKIGDLDGTVRPSLTSTATHSRINGYWPVDLNDQEVSSGDEFSVELDLQDLTAGLLTLGLNDQEVSFVSFSWGGPENDLDRVISSKDQVKIGFAGQDMVKLLFKANKDIRLSQVFDREKWDGQLYSNDLISYSPLPRFTESREPSLFSTAYPNPFANFVHLRLMNANSGQAQIHIYDMTGRRVLGRSAEVEDGQNEFIIQAEDLSGPGMYFYQIHNGSQTTQGKLQMID